MTDKKRILYLDMARGVGMILVVLGHVPYIDSGVRQFITVFHMPLFFLISGILLEQKGEEEKNYFGLIRKKLRSIMIPYVVFSLLSFLLESSRIVLKGLDEWNVVLRQLFQSCCLQGVSTLWFLPALFISELLFLGIRKKTNHTGTIVCTLVMVVGSAVLNYYEKIFYYYHAVSRSYRLLHDVCSMIIRNIFCVGFICIGYYLSKWLLKKLKNRMQEAVSLIVCAVLACMLISKAGSVDLRFMYYDSLPLFMAGAVMGSMTVIFFCKCMQNIPVKRFKKILEYYGRNSLIIMVTHMDFRIMYISILILQKGFHIEVLQGVYGLFITMLVFLLELPVIWFINRYLPFILGKMKKSS